MMKDHPVNFVAATQAEFRMAQKCAYRDGFGWCNRSFYEGIQATNPCIPCMDYTVCDGPFDSVSDLVYAKKTSGEMIKCKHCSGMVSIDSATGECLCCTEKAMKERYEP
jgi:hypothetical protein